MKQHKRKAQHHQPKEILASTKGSPFQKTSVVLSARLNNQMQVFSTSTLATSFLNGYIFITVIILRC